MTSTKSTNSKELTNKDGECLVEITKLIESMETLTDLDLNRNTLAGLNKYCDATKSEIEEWPCKPLIPKLESSKSITNNLKAIQDYIEKFEYNFTNMQLSTYQKKRTFAAMVDYAKLLIKNSLPIRCLDGFILGAYLSHNIPNCKRFPLRFLSKMKHNESQSYWHIVLGTIYQTRVNNVAKFGSIGISRISTLGYKPCTYDNVMELILDFLNAYSKVGHKVTKITLGLPLTNDIHSADPIFWDILHLNIKNEKIETNSQCYNTLLQIIDSFFKQSSNIRHCMLDGKEPKSKIHYQIQWNSKQSHFQWISQSNNDCN